MTTYHCPVCSRRWRDDGTPVPADAEAVAQICSWRCLVEYAKGPVTRGNAV